MFNNKKGVAIRNIVVGISFLFEFAVLSMFGTILGMAILTEWSGTVWGVEFANVITAFQGVFSLFDTLTVFALFGLLIGMIVTTYRLATLPVFFVIYFISAAFIGFIAFVIDYVFWSIASNPAFASVVSLYPTTILICTNLHWIAFGMGIIGVIGLYAKRERGQFLSN